MAEATIQPPAVQPPMTERQRKWFASVREGLERETGRSLTDWVAIARTCPETAPRARMRWFKDTHGLMQNRASYVLSEAFGSSMGWSAPDALVDALWADPAARSVYEAVDALVMALPEVIRTPRKGFTGYAHAFQFAALRPVKGGGARLGLALEPDADPRLEAVGKESWSERLHAVLVLSSAKDADADLGALLRQAWARS